MDEPVSHTMKSRFRSLPLVAYLEEWRMQQAHIDAKRRSDDIDIIAIIMNRKLAGCAYLFHAGIVSFSVSNAIGVPEKSLARFSVTECTIGRAFNEMRRQRRSPADIAWHSVLDYHGRNTRLLLNGSKYEQY